MVETRSGRHISPIQSTTNTIRSGSRRRSKLKDSSPAPLENLSNSNEESSLEMLAGHASIPEVVAQTLPDRSKSSSESQEPVGSSFEVITTTEVKGVGNTSGSKDVNQNTSNLKPTEVVDHPDSGSSFDKKDTTTENAGPIAMTEQPDREPLHMEEGINTSDLVSVKVFEQIEPKSSQKEESIDMKGSKPVEMTDTSEHEPSYAEEDIDATFVTASESPIKVPALQQREYEAQTASREEISRPKAIHKRFEDEEPQTIVSHQQTTKDRLLIPDQIVSEEQSFITASNDENQDDESDDDAPEEITTSVGAQQARLTAAKTAQSIQNQETVTRAKRRQRDEEFKAQARATKKRKAMSESRPNASTSVSDSLLAPEILDDDELPDELPEEILAREPVRLSNATEINHGTTNIPNKRRRLDQDVKPAKDLHFGTTNVRVLPRTNLSLPPPAARQAANIKEAWLKARAEESRKKMASYRIKGAGARSFLRR